MYPPMSPDALPASPRQLDAVAPDHLPALFLRSEPSRRRFWEFSTIHIRPSAMAS